LLPCSRSSSASTSGNWKAVPAAEVQKTRSSTSQSIAERPPASSTGWRWPFFSASSASVIFKPFQ